MKSQSTTKSHLFWSIAAVHNFQSTWWKRNTLMKNKLEELSSSYHLHWSTCSIWSGVSSTTIWSQQISYSITGAWRYWTLGCARWWTLRTRRSTWHPRASELTGTYRPKRSWTTLRYRQRWTYGRWGSFPMSCCMGGGRLGMESIRQRFFKRELFSKRWRCNFQQIRSSRWVKRPRSLSGHVWGTIPRRG